MRVSGFTFIRNGTILGYPYIESIKSILPIVDEFVVNVGLSEDDTVEQIRAIGDPKIRIIESVWNENMKVKGFVYAQQTMIALYNCTGDWAFYLQGDEVVQENDLATIRKSMEKHLQNPNIEGLIFDYYHFFGDPDTLAIGPGAYRREVRIVKTSIRTFVPTDAQFFIVLNKRRSGRYPRVAHAGAHIYHYGNARSVEKMQKKLYQGYWGGKMLRGGKTQQLTSYRYQADPKALGPFTGNHPVFMGRWLKDIAEQKFVPDPLYKLSSKDRRRRRLMWLERTFGLELSKKHYHLVRSP